MSTVILAMLDGPLAGQTLTIDATAPVLVGRSSECHVCLKADSSISRHHCRIDFDPPKAWLFDLGSANGTYLNGELLPKGLHWSSVAASANGFVHQSELKDGDEIQIGRTRMKVNLTGAPAGTSAPNRLTPSPADQAPDVSEMTDPSFLLAGPPAPRVASVAPRPADPPAVPPVVRVPPHQVDDASSAAATSGALASIPPSPAMTLPPALPSPLRGDGWPRELPELEGYEVRRRIGIRDNMVEYLACRTRDDQPVTIWVFTDRLGAQETGRERLRRAVAAVRALEHPNLLAILDYQEIGPQIVVVMEYAAGGSVADLLRRHGGRLAPAQAAPIFLGALAGLAYLHEHHLVHRNLSPASLLVAGDGPTSSVKLSDYELTRGITAIVAPDITTSGHFAGIAEFMPAEQVQDFSRMDPSGDVWSIGAVFYHVLSGQYPRDHAPGTDVLRAIAASRSTLLRQRCSEVPASLAAVIDRATAPTIRDRFPHAVGMLNAMRVALAADGIL